MIRGKLLTARQCESAKPGATRLELPDGGTGLYLVIQPSGKKSWAFRYRYKGKPRKVTIGRFSAFTLAEARQEAGELAKAVDKGRDPAFEKQEEKVRQPDLVRSLGARFIEEYHKPRNRSWKAVERTFELHLYPALGDRDIKSVERRDIRTTLSRAAGTGPTTANRVLAHVRKFFHWVVDQEIISESPCTGLKAPSSEQHRDRILTDDELIAFMRAVDRMDEPPTGKRKKLKTPFGSMFKLLLFTTARRTEVAAAPWAEFDVAKAVWTLPGERAKNGRTCEIPLSPQAVTVVEGLPTKGKDEHLFPSATTEGRTATGFGRAKARLDRLMIEELRKLAEERGTDTDKVKLPDWRLHDLRRTAASGMARLGTGIHVVERLLNHVSGSTTGGIVAVYQRHDFADEKRAAVSAWAIWLDRLASAKPTANVVSLRR